MSLADLDVTQLEILGAMFISLVLGGLIGFEREAADKPAGLRTHMLVAAAVTLIVDLGDVAIQIFSDRAVSNSLVRADPIRIIEAVTAGISFLGAGTILRRRGGKDIEGLTTAASILFTAAVGIAVALSQYIIAVGGTFLALFVLRMVHLVESLIRKDPSAQDEQREEEAAR